MPINYPTGFVNSFISQYKIDAVAFFSPSAVRAFFAQAQISENIKIAVIGTTTEAALPEGYKAKMPEKQTGESMAELLTGRGNQVSPFPTSPSF
jgi:uroporphyrinogen-III synthase